MCRRPFRSSSGLTRHHCDRAKRMSRAARNNYRHECEHCGRQFSRFLLLFIFCWEHSPTKNHVETNTRQDTGDVGHRTCNAVPNSVDFAISLSSLLSCLFVCFFYLNSFRAQAILPSHQRKNLRFLLRTNIIL